MFILRQQYRTRPIITTTTSTSLNITVSSHRMGSKTKLKIHFKTWHSPVLKCQFYIQDQLWLLLVFIVHIFQGLQGIFKRYENRSNVMFNIRRYAPKSRTNKLVEHNCDLKGPNKVWIFICLLNWICKYIPWLYM